MMTIVDWETIKIRHQYCQGVNKEAWHEIQREAHHHRGALLEQCEMLWEHRGKLQDKLKGLLEILQEISEGKGAYDQDHFQHCKNTVSDMKELAQQGIDQIPIGWTYEDSRV